MTHDEAVKLMGQIVTVKVELRRKVSCGGLDEPINRHLQVKEWKEVIGEPRSGWIVGTRWLQNGELYPSDGYEAAHLEEHSRVHCLMVAYWPTMTPVPVPLDGYEMGGTPLSPHQWQCQPLPERIEP